jgi:phosphoglycolate phosphatase-like HAD superfamily hydrolase
VISEAEFTNCFRLPLDSFFAHLGLNDAHEARLAWNAQMRGVVPALAPGARRLLEDSASDGMVVGVLSAADTKLVQEDITALCLTELVAFVVGNADSKADVLKALAVASGRVPTYIGDTEHDMQEARAAGARALGYAGGYRPSEALREAGAEAVFSHLAQVRPALLAKNPLRDSV